MKYSQKDKLLGHMRRQWVTPLDALRLVGCLSLSQRVGELRRIGVVVMDRWVRVGPEKKRVKAYKVGR